MLVVRPAAKLTAEVVVGAVDEGRTLRYPAAAGATAVRLSRASPPDRPGVGESASSPTGTATTAPAGTWRGGEDPLGFLVSRARLVTARREPLRSVLGACSSQLTGTRATTAPSVSWSRNDGRACPVPTGRICTEVLHRSPSDRVRPEQLSTG
ncbi:hypothetical protein GCM10009814_22570 [Lapillicoccus jejuensis]